MMKISDENILNSFIEIDRELNKAEVSPLDSYVVDDGWNAYNNGSISEGSHEQSGATINNKGLLRSLEVTSEYGLDREADITSIVH